MSRYGGLFVPTVNGSTSLLVVGQDGWPLRKDGKLASKLQRARRLSQAGQALTIIAEEELLARVGLVQRSQAICQLYTTAELTQLLGISGNHLRTWIHRGLLEPVKTVDGVSFFDFHQLSGVRTLCRLERAGVSLTRIRRSLEQIRAWLPALDQPLAQLAGLEQNGRLLVRMDNGCLAEPSGQLWFDFDDAKNSTAGTVADGSPSADWHFEQGCQHETAGRLREAAAAYREALQVGPPDADTCFNLANVLYGLGQKEQAVERYRQVVELDACHAEAWNNLGNVLADLGETDEAMQAYQNALRADAQYADAHYNLADTLEQLGRRHEASPHWRAYLQYDRTSRWASHARKALLAASGG